jgi:hypothetical protein
MAVTSASQLDLKMRQPCFERELMLVFARDVRVKARKSLLMVPKLKTLKRLPSAVGLASGPA